MITIDEAKAQAAALRACAEASPVRQYRYPLQRQAKEWEHAVTELEDGGEDEGVIELASSVAPGMRVFMGESGWCVVLRTMAQAGQYSVHVEDPFDSRGRYVNRIGPTSPMVVKR